MDEFIHFIYLGAAASFAVTPFKRSRERATWARWIFFTVAAVFIFLAACGLSLDFQFWQPTEHGRRLLEHYLEGVRGFLLGCVFVLLVTGQLFGKRVLKDETVA
jgi:hypothetical protein